MTEIQLKPCPFCSDPVILKDYTDRIYGFWDYRIECKCGCKFVSPSTAVTDLNNENFRQIRNEKTKAMALEILISRWNRRAE